ncbi:MAG: DMT family transporter [Nocardioidaceae bacterium]
MHPATTVSTVGGLLAAWLLGGLVAVQAHLNSRLAHELGGGLDGAADGALLSFGFGFVVLCLVLCVAPAQRRGLRQVVAVVRGGHLRRWQLIGGTAGAFVVASQSLTVGTIGVALFIVALVAGQTSSALLADMVGAGPGGRQAITLGRAAGAVLALVAVVLAVSDRLGGAATLAPAALLLAVLPLTAGGMTAWQQGFNGRISVAGGPIPAAFINFGVGTAVLALFALVAASTPGGVSAPPAPWGPQWWLYIGGVIGVIFISAAAVLVRVLGVLVFGLCAVAGQVMGALLIDLFLVRVEVGALTVAGAVLTLVGVAIAAGSGRLRVRPVRVLGDDEGRETAPAEPGATGQ